MASKPKLVPLTQSKAYTTFTRDRDKALERILWVHLKAADSIIGKLRDKCIRLVPDHRACLAAARGQPGPFRHEFDLAAAQIAQLMKRLRKESYFLAHMSEAEAIGRALCKPARFHVVNKGREHHVLHDGAMIDDRAQLMLDKIRRKLEEGLSLSIVLHATPEDTIDRVKRAFGNAGPRPQPQRALKGKRFKEADDEPAEDPGSTIRSMSFGFADEDLWDNVVDDYYAENLPADIFRRGPRDKVLFYDATLGTQEDRYAWQVENEITEDFVRSVRAGTQDAAAENGITDLEWVAILDGKTDECCRDRDGHSSAEIEKLLADGTLDADVCDAIVVPAHLWCRCNSVPMTADLPEAPDVDYAGFDKWLDARGKAA